MSIEEPTPLRQLLAQHQENAVAASLLSLLWAFAYAVAKRFDFKTALTAAGIAALSSATIWLFLAAYVNPTILFLLPVGVGCGVGAFPIMRAYTKKDEALADEIVTGAGSFLSRWMKKFTGGA